MNTFLMMFSIRDLIVLGIILAITILVIVISIFVSSKKRKRRLELAEEEADFYCDLYYFRQMKEAEIKYKAFEARGYLEKLPAPLEAIEKYKQMQDLLEQTDALTKRKAILEEYLPNIMLALIRCKEEGMGAIPKKEVFQIKKLMKEYGVTDNQQLKGK